VQELHSLYYEPLARVAGSLEELLQGPPVKKVLFMTDPRIVDSKLKPHWGVRPPFPCFFEGPCAKLVLSPLLVGQ
jgi:hypothetical protein